jgi:DNA-binding NtrC family response regulator
MAKILVIDDDDAVRLSLKLALEDAGHHVEDAVNGNEGMTRFRASPAEVVITDIFMPEKEGLETIDEIKRDRPQTKIVAISGGGSMDPENYLVIAKRVGADRALFKPFDIQLLLATVDELLGARKE